MVDLLPILEGLAYVGFIAGAIFAVWELRSISTDRRMEWATRLGEIWISRDFAEALSKWDTTDWQSAETAEKTCPKVELIMMAEYFEHAAGLAIDKYISKRYALEQFDFETPWSKMKPWCLEWRRRTAPGELSSFEFMADRQREERLAKERRMKGV